MKGVFIILGLLLLIAAYFTYEASYVIAAIVLAVFGLILLVAGGANPTGSDFEGWDGDGGDGGDD